MRNGLKQLTAQPHASFLSSSGEFVSDDSYCIYPQIHKAFIKTIPDQLWILDLNLQLFWILNINFVYTDGELKHREYAICQGETYL